MQKLLRINPSGPPFLQSNTTHNFLSPLGFNFNPKFLSLGFKNHRKKKNPLLFPFSTSTQLVMTAALHFRPSAYGSAAVKAAAAAISRKPTSVNGGSCRICRCSLESDVPSRAWVAMKESRCGSRSAWFHTDAGANEKGFLVAAKSFEGGGESGDDLEEKPTVRLNRRQRSSGLSGGNATAVAGLLPGNPDLLTIPGVGPRNLKKLVEKGIGGVAELKQIYKDKFFGKSSEKMVEFLQGSVGIIHKNHAESITTYIKESVDEDLKEDTSNLDVKSSPKKRLTFCVEGNISVGKSTFLQRIANETLELQDLVEIVPEPINKWQDVGPEHFNILDAFYAEPERYAYTFQNYVFVTRLMQEKESSGGIKPLRLMERSVFSDRMVFVRAVHEAKWMNEMEISIYDSWFDPVVSSLPGLIPDAFIYLRASPDTCHKRMMLRKRAEEGGVSLDYLRGLHEKHESWLFPSQTGIHGVFSVSKLPFHVDCSLPADIRDRVFYLEGEHMHSSIQKVPALVLDCEPNIDFNKDIEAKRQYARQVADFFEFVKKKKEVPVGEAAATAAKSSQTPLLMPHQGGLWMPNGKPFPDSALNSLDFRRAMSFMSG